MRGIPEDTLGHLRDRALIALMYATAFRCVSIVRADVEDLDWDRLTIVHHPKGHVAKDTAAALPQSVAGIQRRYLDRRCRECGSSAAPQPLFIALDRRSRGHRMTTKSVRVQTVTYTQATGLIPTICRR